MAASLHGLQPRSSGGTINLQWLFRQQFANTLDDPSDLGRGKAGPPSRDPRRRWGQPAIIYFRPLVRV